MSSELIRFSRAKIETFEACRRRFRLRYVDRLPWPEPPYTAAQTAAMRHGNQFHQLVAQHYLDLPLTEAWMELPAPVKQWWRAFQEYHPRLPADAQLLPETMVSVSFRGHQLIGRFDLIVLTADGRIHIYDWKTGRPRSEWNLRDDWQTRLYLTLAVEGASAFGLSAVDPADVRLTYWYVKNPADSCTLTYSSARHDRNLADLTDLIAAVEDEHGRPHGWPLTADIKECARCAYQAYCGRQEAVRLLEEPATAPDDGTGETEPDTAEAESWSDVAAMEPDAPA